MNDPKMTVHNEAAAQPKPPTPTEEILAKVFEAETLPYTGEDGKPHTIDVRKPSVLAEFHLIEALGDVAANETYMRMVMPLIYLGAIDGDPISPPISKLEVEALIQRLDRTGLGTLMSWWVTNVNAEMANAAAQAKAKAAIKN